MSLQPFRVRLQSYADGCRSRGSEEELTICLLLRQESNYTTFTESFQLNLGPSAVEMVSLENGTRNTLVIVEETGAPTYAKVCTAGRAINTTEGHRAMASFCRNSTLLFFYPQFKDINAKPEKGNNAIR